MGDVPRFLRMLCCFQYCVYLFLQCCPRMSLRGSSYIHWCGASAVCSRSKTAWRYEQHIFFEPFVNLSYSAFSLFHINIFALHSHVPCLYLFSLCDRNELFLCQRGYCTASLVLKCWSYICCRVSPPVVTQVRTQRYKIIIVRKINKDAWNKNMLDFAVEVVGFTPVYSVFETTWLSGIFVLVV